MKKNIEELYKDKLEHKQFDIPSNAFDKIHAQSSKLMETNPLDSAVNFIGGRNLLYLLIGSISLNFIIFFHKGFTTSDSQLPQIVPSSSVEFKVEDEKQEIKITESDVKVAPLVESQQAIEHKVEIDDYGKNNQLRETEAPEFLESGTAPVVERNEDKTIEDVKQANKTSIYDKMKVQKQEGYELFVPVDSSKKLKYDKIHVDKE